MASDRILVVDDDDIYRQTLESQLSGLGYQTEGAENGRAAEDLLKPDQFSLILLDLRLPDTDGLSLLKNWKGLYPRLPIIMVSGEGTIPEAVEALKYGATDFLVKPVDVIHLEAVIKRTLETQELQRENVRLKQLTRVEETKFLGDSPAIKTLLTEVQKVAQSDHPVLLEGETGTGKQILAQHIHTNSSRAEEPFVCINCAAITQSLFESELFGHEKGAFTGAHARKAGKLELVGRGTLFLDEIGELPAACQAKLLTVVENRIFERVGGTQMLLFDGRIIAATNRDLDEELERGGFRRDLFFRLSTFRFRLPPIREHPEDVPIFIESTLTRCVKAYGRPFDGPDDDTVDKLMRYPWPGNIRELIHHIERIALLSEGRRIPRQLWLSFPTISGGRPESSASDLALAMNDFKKQHIYDALAKCGGNQTEAAKRLGIGRTHLNRLLAEYKSEEEELGD